MAHTKKTARIRRPRLPHEEHSKKRRKLDFSNEFKVVVGTDAAQKTYTVAKDILTKSSAFFQKACNKKWQEGQTKVVELPEAEPEVFEIYLQLLYSGEVVLADDRQDQGNNEEDDDLKNVPRVRDGEAIASLLETYFLADMLLDRPGKNTIIDQISEKAESSNAGPSPTIVERVYNQTIPSSPLRRFLVNLTASDHDIKYYNSKLVDFLPQFVADLAYKFMVLNKDNEIPESPECQHMCTYHEHEETDKKCD